MKDKPNEPSGDLVAEKLKKVVLPFELSPLYVLNYYPGADLLLARYGLAENAYFTINRQNLIRFFQSYEDARLWLGRHRYQDPGDEPPTTHPALAPTKTAKRVLSIVRGES